MLRHICMFKLVSVDEADTFIEKAQVLKDLPMVKGFDVVKNAEGMPESNFTVSLIIDFDNAEGLAQYQTCPTHVGFGKYVATVKTDRACIDYEF